jgi:hypothetical protein
LHGGKRRRKNAKTKEYDMKFFVTNKIDFSLTGNQIAKLFDSITHQILYSLNLFTTVLDTNLVQILSWVSNNKRKKISPISRDSQMKLLYYFIATADINERYEILCQLKLDRFYVRKLADIFLKRTADYKQLYKKLLNKIADDSDMLRMSEIENECQCPRLYLYPLILNLEGYLETYKEISDIILSKYYKFLWSLVKKRTAHSNRHFDEDELYQNYISATLKAFDRYDPDKGALTSYIGLWIKNNQQSAEENPEYSIAYELPASQLQKQVKKDTDIYVHTEDNFSISLESLLEAGELSDTTLGVDSYSPEKIREEEDSKSILLCLAKYADHTGVARLALGIQEYMDLGTLTAMCSDMEKTGLASIGTNSA